MASDDLMASRAMVRMYSWDVDERLPPGSDAHVLGQVLSHDIDREEFQRLTLPWRKFFDPDESINENNNSLTELIAVESANLRKRWIIFHKNNLKEERLDLERFEPTIESVVDMIDEITKAWRVKSGKGWRGKAATLFHRFSRTLNSHKEFLTMIPQGNQYISIFTGALNAILKASANHEKIAEGFSEALCAISECISQCKVEQALFQTPTMLECSQDLYAHIFLFLASVMDWLIEKRRKRLLDSFNENFSKNFEDQIKLIQHKAELIKRLAEQSVRAETRVMRLTMENMQRDIRIGLQAGARQQAEIRYWGERITQELEEARKEREQIPEGWTQVAIQTNRMLQEVAMAWISTTREGQSRAPVSLLHTLNPPLIASQSPNVMNQLTAHDVSVDSRGLENFFSRTRVRISCDSSSLVMVDPETLSHLSRWSEAGMSSSVMWLDGPPIDSEDLDNPLTMMAAKFVDLAYRSKIPIISYFCQLSRSNPAHGGHTRESQAAIALLYALVRQAIELLLPQFETTIDLSERRFQQLDGSLETWDDTLSLFKDLTELIPEGVLCAIDGLHWLGDRRTDRYLRGLIHELRASKLKVLFTTTGRSACLHQELSRTETVRLESLQPRLLVEVVDMEPLVAV